MRPRLQDFEGAWRIARAIHPADGAGARFDGEARFRPDGQGLAYAEIGQLQLAGHPPVRAERCYLWRNGPAGVIEVFFPDGRPFHRIDLGAAAPSDRHLCDPDIYDVTYDFRRWPDWSSRWRVRGPRKDYRMISEYFRLETG